MDSLIKGDVWCGVVWFFYNNVEVCYFIDFFVLNVYESNLGKIPYF
jgi:hypothetical protein